MLAQAANADDGFEAPDRLGCLPTNPERCRFEFTRPYVGGDAVPRQLESYIAQCAGWYVAEPTRFVCPSLAIVQSSGYGKSRLLRELANRTKDDPCGHMKVLYTCVRPDHVRSSGYPFATVNLRKYLFPDAEYGEREENKLAAKLCRLYDFAICNWNSVGREWFSLFDDQADFRICDRLKRHSASGRDGSSPLRQSRIVVLAVDEARFLLETRPYDHTGWYKRLRQALVTASTQLRDTFGPCAGIFAVIVDASSTIIRHYNDAVRDLDGRLRQNVLRGREELFPPFVLTQTTDVRFDVLKERAQREGISSDAFYRELVARDHKEAWSVLVVMGRPLWDVVAPGNAGKKAESGDVIQLAADKLLGGLDAQRQQSFNAGSLFGVGSLLCRLGLRPSSWSPLAPLSIARLMATLVHVDATNQRFLTTYGSEPVLTFGAARVWYQSAPVGDAHYMMDRYILPHFRSLLCQGVVDMSGERGDLVTRIVLLLAMDATCAVVAPCWERDTRQYEGAFHSVETFLDVLLGNRQPSTIPHDILRGWCDWKLGFSHFVQVSKEPSVSDLWTLLARRAAGVFPREYDAVDLFIPIFRGTVVSMILVQTTYDDEVELPSLVSLMHPSSVFTNDFKDRAPMDMVFVVMRFCRTSMVRRRSWLPVSEPSDEDSASQVTVLCLDGLHAWDAQGVHATHGERGVAVVSSTTARELRKLLDPWWEPINMVEEALTRPGYRDVMHPDAVKSIASRPLVESLLVTDDSDQED